VMSVYRVVGEKTLNLLLQKNMCLDKCEVIDNGVCGHKQLHMGSFW
jgi:hypothetical protein